MRDFGHRTRQVRNDRAGNLVAAAVGESVSADHGNGALVRVGGEGCGVAGGDGPRGGAVSIKTKGKVDSLVALCDGQKAQWASKTGAKTE